MVDGVNDKALFTMKLIFTLAVIAGLCAIAVNGADAMTLKIVQASGGLNVRAEPSVEAKAVYLLENCETVVVLEERQGWALVAKNLPPHGVLGWACADYLK